MSHPNEINLSVNEEDEEEQKDFEDLIKQTETDANPLSNLLSVSLNISSNTNITDGTTVKVQGCL